MARTESIYRVQHPSGGHPMGDSAAFGGAPHGRLEAAAWLGTSLNGIDGSETLGAGGGAAPVGGRAFRTGKTVTRRS